MTPSFPPLIYSDVFCAGFLVVRCFLWPFFLSSFPSLHFFPVETENQNLYSPNYIIHFLSISCGLLPHPILRRRSIISVTKLMNLYGFPYTLLMPHVLQNKSTVLGIASGQIFSDSCFLFLLLEEMQ